MSKSLPFPQLESQTKQHDDAKKESALLALTGAIGNLEAYIQRVQQIPLLSAEEEQYYAKRLHQNNDLEAARKLVLSHLRLVVSIARSYLGYGLPHADLIQEGNIGLMKAVKRFDPSQNVRLVSYAIHWIKAEIHEYVLRNWRLVKIATTKAQRKLFFNLRSNKQGMHSLTQDEIHHLAETLNVKQEEVIEMDKRISGADIALDTPTTENHDETFAPIQYLADTNYEPTQVIQNHQYDLLQSEGIKAALNHLDERSRRIIEARWLHQDENESSKTLHELAEEFGVSAERIRQIEVSAMKKMRQVLIEYQNEMH